MTPFDGVSTVLPVYLEPDPAAIRLLARAAGSVLGQESALPLELVVVDDGSPCAPIDRPELAPLLRRPDVRYIRLRRNHGLTFALNAGLASARYGLIARIDADDYWRPSKLRKQLALFESDPDLTIAGTGMRLVHANSESDANHLRGSSWQDVLDFFGSAGCPLPHGSILARKDVFQLLGGYPHDPLYRACEDFALWGVWVRFFKAAMVPEVLFEYTVSAGQLSSRNAEQQHLASVVVQRRFDELDNRREIPDAMARLAGELGHTLLETGKTLYAAWRHYEHIVADPGIFGWVRALLPDRKVYRSEEAAGLVVERIFYLHTNREWNADGLLSGARVYDSRAIAPLWS